MSSMLRKEAMVMSIRYVHHFRVPTNKMVKIVEFGCEMWIRFLYLPIHTEYIDENSVYSEIPVVRMAVHPGGAVAITLTQYSSPTDPAMVAFSTHHIPHLVSKVSHIVI